MAKPKNPARRRPNAPAKTTKPEIRLDRVLLYGLAFLLFALPLFIWPTISEYGYGKTIVAIVGVAALSVLWGIDAWRKGKWEGRIPWIAIPFVAFVVASLFSLLHATNGRVVVQSLVLIGVFFQLLVLIQHAAREKRDVCLLLFSFLASVSLVSLYGLLQYLGVMKGPPGANGLTRIISTLGNKEYLGGLLSYILLPSVVLLLRLRSAILRAVAVALISFNFGTLMLVQQTGPNVALILAVLAFLGGWLIFRPVEPLRTARRWLVALLVFLALTFLIEAPSGPLNSVVGLSADGRSWVATLWESNSGSVRAWDWWIGLEMLKAHPLTGIGLGNYKLDFVDYKARFLATPQGASYDFHIPRAAQAHNEYVQIAAELGALGIAALVALWTVLALSVGLRLRRNRDEADRMDLLLFASGLVALCAHAVVSFPAHLPVSSLAGVLLCGLMGSSTYGTSATWKATLKGWGLRGSVVVVSIVGLAVSTLAVRDMQANVLMVRGISELQLGSSRAAITTLEQSVRLDFAPRQTYFYLASAEAQLGNREAAFGYLEKCLTRFVDEATYLAYAELANSLGKTAEAQRKIDLLLASNPRPDLATKARYVEALISIQERDYSKAVQQLEKLVVSAPNFESARIALANLYMSRGQTAEARRVYESALRLIEKNLAAAEQKLATTTEFTAETYGDLRTSISTLRSERDFVRERLAALPDS